MLELMPWNTKEGNVFAGFKNEFDNLYKRFFGHEFIGSHGVLKEGELIPSVDMKESKSGITIKAEIPGCDAKDIHVHLNGRNLLIKGEKKQEKEETDENIHRVERFFGSFSRTLVLLSDVDQENIDAVYKDGVLTLVFKKTKEEKGRQIEIKKG